MSRLVENDECRRCGESIDPLRVLCSSCAKKVRRERGGPL